MLGAHAPCFDEKGFGATSQCFEMQALAHVRHKSDSAGLGTATPPDANYVCKRQGEGCAASTGYAQNGGAAGRKKKQNKKF